MGISQKNEDCQRQSNCQPTTQRRPQSIDCLVATRCFPKSARILSNRHFQALFRTKNRLTGNYICVDYRKGKSSRPKLGITVSKKFGKAHDRNRFKRLVREVFRTSYHLFPQDLEINVIPRLSFKNVNKNAILEDIIFLLSKIHSDAEP